MAETPEGLLGHVGIYEVAVAIFGDVAPAMALATYWRSCVGGGSGDRNTRSSDGKRNISRTCVSAGKTPSSVLISSTWE